MSVPAIFQDATRTGATHRKNVVALRKLHLRKGPALNADIRDCVLRVLPLKKGNQEAERVLKFLTSYLEEFESGDEVAAQILEGLVSELLELALRGLKVKDKVVRYRSCTMIRLLLNHMDEIDEEKFIEIQEALFERTRDKESTVRVQAALAVSRLQDSPDEDDEDSVAQNEQVRECLLAMLQHDTSSEVRKAVLWNISVDSSTLPFILQRTRDVDPQVRRFAFKKIGQDVEKMVHLTADERDVILHNGLSDRDSNVQKAAVALLCDHWIPQCEDSLLNLLHKMDVVSGNAAEPIVKAYMLANPATQMKYDEETWNNLDVEEAFLLRMAITFYGENKQQDELDAALPPLGKHADLLQKYALLMAQTTDQDEAISFAFILKQLLLVGELQDFGDEMGRRDLLLCLRDMLASLDLFKDNILIIVRILKKLSSNESDFTRVVIEVLYTIYDVDLQESQSRSEGSSDEEIDADLETEKAMQMLKCLDVIGCVLECTEENLNDNASMAGILESFILPSLKSTHLDTQFAAFQCLSLACLLDRTLAVAHLKLFLSAFHDPRIELSTLAMQVFFDLAVLFGTDSMLDKELLSELISGNLQCEDEGLLTLAVEGAAKLMMLGCLTDPIILQHVVVLYYHPHTREMNRLRQCLSYFMPVFAHASHANQRLLQTVVVPTLELLGQEYVDSKDMLSPTHIGQQLIDWCDPRKVVRLDGGSTPSDEEGSHGDLAVLMLAAIEESDDPVMQKLYAQLLSKLYLGLFVAPEKLAQIAEATASQIQMLPKPSAVVNPLKKFAKSIADLDETSVAAGTADEFLKQQNLIVAMSGLRLQADPNRLPTAAVAGEASGDEDD